MNYSKFDQKFGYQKQGGFIGSVVKGIAGLAKKAAGAVTKSSFLPSTLTGWSNVAGTALSGIGAFQNYRNQAFQNQQIAANNQQALDIDKRNFKEAKYLARNPITIRVKDALRNGIHPLAALGVSPISGSGGSMPYLQTEQGGLGDVVSDFGKTISNTAIARKQLELHESKAQASIELDKANAEYLRSQAKLLRDKSGTLQVYGYGEKDGPGLYHDSLTTKSGMVEIKPNEIVSHKKGNKSATAGKKPLWDEYTVNKKGESIYLPSADNPSESLESGGAIALSLMHPHNQKLIKKYGKKWFYKTFKVKLEVQKQLDKM